MSRQGRLLLVDDNENNRDALSRRLRQRGYVVTLAGDGREALALTDAEPYDLVLLDVEMPGMNGLEVLSQLRRSRSQTELPVIMVTARTQGADIVEAFRLGANDYVTKPIDVPVAFARIGTHLALKWASEDLREALLAVRDANLQLESRVVERTRELAAANETLRRSEEQLRHSQKLEAAGRLAGGVAHDYNNFLTVIFAYLDLLLDGEPDAEVREVVGEMRKAAESAASLTTQLLAFSRQQQLSPKVLNLSDLVRDTLPLLRRLVGADVEFVTDVSVEIEPVLADPGQVQQVLLNLVVNARDAMPQGGTLTVTTCRVLGGGSAMSEAAAGPGPYAKISVTDTGTGMSADTRTRIFEPFFTTKALGRGTGLGLATVYGIVKQSGGYIDVESELDRGTTFHVFLPHVLETPETTSRGAVVAREDGTGLILLVEDEDAVRNVVRLWLERRGYTVIDARDAAEARQRLVSIDRVDLLLTDVVMPVTSGYALAAELTRARPHLKVLFMTGHVDDAEVVRNIRDTHLPLVQKPLTAASLLDAVRGVLKSPIPPPWPGKRRHSQRLT